MSAISLIFPSFLLPPPFSLMPLRNFWSLWTPWRRVFVIIFSVFLIGPFFALLGYGLVKWPQITNPYRYAAIDLNPLGGLTLTGALMSVKPDEGKMYIEWRVGGVGNDYARSESESSSLCSLYNTMPGFSDSDAIKRHQIIWFDGQPVFNSSKVADQSSGQILPCADYTSGGREFTFGHTLDVGLDYHAQRTVHNSYPYEFWTTSSRICAFDPERREKSTIVSTAVLVSRVDGFLVRSKFSQIKSETDAPGYVLTLTLERDSFARFFAICLWAIGWILAVLAVIYAVLTPLWAYKNPGVPQPSTIRFRRFIAVRGVRTLNSIYRGSLRYPAPPREANKTSDALWVTVTIGGILIVIRGQYPGSPPLATYLDYFGFYPSFLLTALTLLLGIAVSSRIIDTCIA
ncbi:hypothetical protein M407DRAFT_22218 [Tulasnella calospora MUT 4182]|uniref:Uncharacterized protein n=1 Tax=Tulasnella calospora MUT 4182 TaxID=1051891 RepID=A0A0C3QLT1_9AGAM|nr:hypothetical protein M407DRAFT_22218 [Tulasnella calospora MUT 4182]